MILVEQGFTFIEVLVAMLIFVMAGLAAVDIARGSVLATRDAKDISQATWLLQNVIVEAETHLETDGIDKACDKKKEGKFDPPNDRFSWTLTCEKIDFHLSEAAAKVAQQQSKGDQDSDSESKESMIEKMILQTASDYLTQSIRELHAEVAWLQGKTKKNVSLTTHFARYDQPLNIPGIGGAGTGTGTGTGATASTSPDNRRVPIEPPNSSSPPGTQLASPSSRFFSRWHYSPSSALPRRDIFPRLRTPRRPLSRIWTCTTA